MKKISIVYGGSGSESKISALTATNFKKALDELGYENKMINFSDNPIQEILKYNPDIVLNAKHGAFGEDGRLAGALDILKIPYTHSHFFPSGIAMDKLMTKEVMRLNNIPCLPDIVVTKKQLLDNSWKEMILKDDKLSFRRSFFIKEVNEGSAVGCFAVNNIVEHQFKDSDFLPTHKKFLIEPRASGREITIPILENKAVGILEIVPKKNTFYDYRSKYDDQGSEHPVLVIEDKLLERKILQDAEKLHNAIGLSNISRIDGFLLTDDSFIFLEINANPGMTNTSLVPDIARQVGIDYNHIIEILIKNASYSL